RIFENAPASKAGVQEGDVVVAIGGKAVTDSNELQSYVASLPLSKPVDMTVIRDGKRVQLRVTVEEQPQQFGTAKAPSLRRSDEEAEGTSLGKLGVEVTDLTPEIADRLNYKSSQKGAVITHVDLDGVAASAGLSRGMLITKIDKQTVNSAAALKDKVGT